MKKKIVKKKVSAKRQRPERKIHKKFTMKELAEFKKIINNFKEKILEGIKHISEEILKKSQKEASGDISGYSYHMADVATDTYDRDFSLGLVSSEREILYELSDALKKIEEGTFGVCEDCKVSIAKTRLRAVPYARLCVKCQEKREKR